MDWEAVGRFTLETAAGAGLQRIVGSSGSALKVAGKIAGSQALLGAGSEALRGNNSVEGWTKGAVIGGGGGLLGHYTGRWLGHGAGKVSAKYAKTMGSLDNRVARHKIRLGDAKTARDNAQNAVNNLGRATRSSRRTQAQQALTDAQTHLAKVEKNLQKAQSVRKGVKKPADRWKTGTDTLKNGWGNHTLVGLGNSAFRAGSRVGWGSDPKGGGGEKKKTPTAKESLTWDGAAPARAEGLM